MAKGRKGKSDEWLEPDGLLRIEGWARDGLTDKQIAKNIGITEQTLNVWKKKFPSFLESLKMGKEVVDREVENALFKRAIGYEYDEICEEYEDGVLTKKKITKKMVVPDTTAQIFWLKNRKPDKWRDKQEYVDTAALDKLDQILEETKKNAYSEPEAE